MHKFTLLILSLLWGAFVFSAPVSQEKASSFAKDFYLNRYNSAFEKTLNDVQFSEIIAYPSNSSALWYVFNIAQNEGFIIISAEDNMLPVLGYSFKGNFDISKMSPATEFWMNRYAEIIESSKNLTTAEPHVAEAWKQKGAESKSQMLLLPLLTTDWDQDCYYNLYAPSDMGGPCSHAYAGCVATSMAMVMKYHNYPATGFGSHSYTHPNYGTLSANFGATTYSWTNMPNQLSSTSSLIQKQSIARLMADCGISVDMNYSANGSGSNIAFSADAFSNYFRYNFASKEETASSYTTAEWIQILRHQLDNNMPLVYSGIDYSVGYGHAWAVDGYQGSSHFHMNWGWSGYNNGYFLLSSLNVNGYSFNDDQSAVFNVKPAQSGCGITNFITKNGRIEDGSAVNNYSNNLNCSYTIDPVSGNIVVLTFSEFNTEFNADFVRVYDGTSASGTLLGEFSGTNLPPVLVANSGAMFITFTTNGSVNASGWKASWSQTMPVYCTNTKLITDIFGTFDDGSGSANYLSNTQCKWLLKPSGASTVSLVFHHFDVHSSDHLYVYNGPNTGSSLIGSYTGANLPANIKSTGNSMLLYFVTNGLYVSQGWEISFFKDALSIDEKSAQNSLIIFPNPANNLLNINMKEYEGEINIEVFSAQGILVKSFETTLHKDEVYPLDISKLNQGIYLLKVMSNQGFSTKTFIKN